jgi:hypothetical protein
MPAMCQLKWWNVQTIDRPKTVNNIKKKPTLDRRWAQFMPAYRQLGNRVSSLVDVKLEKKIRMVRKNFSLTVKLQLTQKLSGNVAIGNYSPKNGEYWSFNCPIFPLIATPKPITHPHRERSGGIGNLERSSANYSILDLP